MDFDTQHLIKSILGKQIEISALTHISTLTHVTITC